MSSTKRFEGQLDLFQEDDSPAPPVPDGPSLDLGEFEVPLRIRRSARARRIGLRIDEFENGVVITLPEGADEAEGLAFAKKSRRWLRENLKALPERVPFADGAALPIRGELLTVRHIQALRGSTQLEGDSLVVTCDAPHIARRIESFYRAEARRDIRPRLKRLAGAIDRVPGRLTIRDTRTRWASCSSNGDFNFSFRLIMAPEQVTEYVVAHEVAHLVHLDHSSDFWDLARELCPDMTSATRWIRRNGSSLHRYG